MLTVKKFIVNPVQENCYLISAENGDCLVVDAGFYFPAEEEEITSYILKNGLNPVGLINTHCHFDHLMGVEFLRKKYGIPFACHAGDLFWLSRASQQAGAFGMTMGNISPEDRLLSEGEKIDLGGSFLEVIHVPGHSPGHVVFYSAEDHFLIAGDVLFSGGIGRSDLPGGNYGQLVDSIRKKLLVLPPETIVWSGHGPETTIGTEKSSNPFLI